MTVVTTAEYLSVSDLLSHHEWVFNIIQMCIFTTARLAAACANNMSLNSLSSCRVCRFTLSATYDVTITVIIILINIWNLEIDSTWLILLLMVDIGDYHTLGCSKRRSWLIFIFIVIFLMIFRLKNVPILLFFVALNFSLRMSFFRRYFTIRFTYSLPYLSFLLLMSSVCSRDWGSLEFKRLSYKLTILSSFYAFCLTALWLA